MYLKDSSVFHQVIWLDNRILSTSIDFGLKNIYAGTLSWKMFYYHSAVKCKGNYQ